MNDDYYSRKHDQGKWDPTAEPIERLCEIWPHETPALRSWMWVTYGARRTAFETLRSLTQDHGAILAVLAFGAKKYEAGSWRHVPDAERRYFAALLRHDLADLNSPGSVDSESGLTHAAHRACNAVFLRELLELDG